MNVRTVGVKLDVHEAPTLIIRRGFFALLVVVSDKNNCPYWREWFSGLLNRFALDMDGFVRSEENRFIFQFTITVQYWATDVSYCRHSIYLQQAYLHGTISRCYIRRLFLGNPRPIGWPAFSALVKLKRKLFDARDARTVDTMDSKIVVYRASSIATCRNIQFQSVVWYLPRVQGL